MRNIHNHHQSNGRKLAVIFSGGAMSVQLALAAFALLPMTGASQALPKSCVIRSYYQTAELDAQVGMRSSCPGAHRWGKVTKFVEVETVDLSPEGPGGPGGGGQLPCEFLVSGCSNLPELRH
jgi:hypothetical protein